MKKNVSFILLLFFSFQASFAQVNEGLVELGKAYRQFMFRNNPPEDFLKGFEKYQGTELAFPAKFLKEAIKENNSILTDEYLKRPADKDLKYLYIIVRINYNIRKENPLNNEDLIRELTGKEILTQDLVDNYYSMLMACYGNKVKPFDMSGVNFDLNAYELKNETEKAIFFLRVMRQCGLQIWGYMNVVKPPNYKLAMDFIGKYPRFNSQPYYQFLDLNFQDFEINIESESKTQRYKAYYIDKYYETLLSHLTCLAEADQDKEKIYDLILGSILKEEIFYKYSKDESRLKKILKKYKK